MISQKNIFVLASIIFISLFAGCGGRPTYDTKSSLFPKMYEEQPRSLLILPPMNESTDAEAKDYYMTTTEMPFALMGYYTFPVEIVSEIMKQEGVYDTELLYNTPLDKFYEYFGADAVLFTRIKKWDLSYAVIASTLTVSIEAQIVSIKTSNELWSYTDTVVVDLSGGNGSRDSIIGLITDALITALNTASADYVRYAHIVNRKLIRTLPAGPYHEMHLKDQDVIINQNR